MKVSITEISTCCSDSPATRRVPTTIYHNLDMSNQYECLSSEDELCTD